MRIVVQPFSAVAWLTLTDPFRSVGFLDSRRPQFSRDHSFARTNCDCGTVSPEGPSDLQAVNSLVVAVGAFCLTDLMPFSMDDADEYISLLPMV